MSIQTATCPLCGGWGYRITWRLWPQIECCAECNGRGYVRV